MYDSNVRHLGSKPSALSSELTGLYAGAQGGPVLPLGTGGRVRADTGTGLSRLPLPWATPAIAVPISGILFTVVIYLGLLLPATSLRPTKFGLSGR